MHDDTNREALTPRDRIFVAGHGGMVGSAIVRRLESEGYENLVVRARSDLDLSDQRAVREFMRAHRPDWVVAAAAKVGGILGNITYPAEFIYENLAIETNLIHESWRNGVRRLLFLGSSCIYPRSAAQPMPEEALLSGRLEPTNEPYAVAKIAGIKLCESYNRQYGTCYRSVMPTNLYGPNDNFDIETSHVVPALLRKCHEARIHGATAMEVWGTGNARRELLHVDDLAEACVFVMKLPDAVYQDATQPVLSHMNVGTGEDITIRELASTIAEVVGFGGTISFDASMPDGAQRKLLDVRKLTALGWRPRIALRDGLRSTYAWYVRHRIDVSPTNHV